MTTIQLRRDTATNWSTTNPVLSSGEAGYDTTNKLLKIGDGVTAWNDLSQYGGEKKDETLNNPYTLFDSKYSETPLYNVSWLKSDGTFYSKSVYVTAYEALVVENNTEIDAGTSVQLPSGTTYIKRGLSVKLSTAEDITDYDFVINTTNETFRLPIKVKLASGKAVVGNGMALGLVPSNTNTTSVAYMISEKASPYELSIHGYTTTPQPAGSSPLATKLADNKNYGVSQNGNLSGIETSDSGLYLYYYVGGTVQNAHLIDAAQIAENIANKANADLSNCTKPYVTETYVNGTSWYRLWSDGWCEQGGQTAALSPSTQTTIELLKEYSNTDYFINVNQPLRIGDQLPTVGIYQKNTANFIVRQSSSGNNAGAYATLWYACGF